MSTVRAKPTLVDEVVTSFHFHMCVGFASFSDTLVVRPQAPYGSGPRRA